MGASEQQKLMAMEKRGAEATLPWITEAARQIVMSMDMMELAISVELPLGCVLRYGSRYQPCKGEVLRHCGEKVFVRNMATGHTTHVHYSRMLGRVR